MFAPASRARASGNNFALLGEPNKEAPPRWGEYSAGLELVGTRGGGYACGDQY